MYSAIKQLCPISLNTLEDTLHILYFNDTPTTVIYTLSLHDALPIWWTTAWPGVTRSSRRPGWPPPAPPDRKSTRLNSSHVEISYAVFCLKKKKNKLTQCGICIA